MPSPRPMLLVSLFALLALPLAAAEPWDAPPFSADPKAVLAAAGEVKAGDADLVLLLDEGTYSVQPDGRTRIGSHMVYRVVTAKGVEMIDATGARWQPWFDERPEIRARVVAPDGSVHTLDPKAVTEASAEYERDIFSDERVLHAPLPGVTAGAVVEIVIEHLGKSVLPGSGSSGIFTFAGSIPEERVRLVLEGPSTFAPHVVNKSGIEPRVVEKDGRKQIIYERGHVDADDSDESYLPSDDMLYPYIAFSTGSSWSELARGYSEIVDKQIAAGDVREIAANAARGATKREEIVDRLLAYVESNVHYAGVETGDGSIVPRVPAGVVKNKYGDCKDKATLLVALLRAAGVPAHVALLSASMGFDVSNELPGLSRFNHAIVVVGGESPIWIDPTDEFAHAGALPPEDQGRMALVAAPETTSLTRTPELPSTAMRAMETRTYTLPEEGKAHVVEVTTGTADQDASLRRYRAESDAEKYKKEMEKYAKSYYVAPKFDKLTVTDPRDLSKPFTLTIEVSDADSGVVMNGDGAVGINLHDLVGHAPSEIREYEEPTPNGTSTPPKKRKHDFVFPRPFVKEWTYRIALPPGYKARTLPDNETKQLGTTTLTRQYNAQPDGVVVAKLTFDSGKRRLTPAEFEQTRLAISKLLKEPEIVLGFDSIGQAKLNAGDVRGALDEFRRLAALHPKEAQHHTEIARALMIGGLGEASREESRKAVALEPNSARAHYAYAVVLERDLVGRPFKSGYDLAGAIAEARKAIQLEPTELVHRVELAELLAWGNDGFRFGRGNHLAEAIDEFKKILKEFGPAAKGYEPRLMLFYIHAGRWNDLKTFLDTMGDSDQKSLGRIIAAAATSGVPAATHELEAFTGDKKRQNAAGVAQTLLALGMYPEAAAMLEIAAQGSTNTQQVQLLLTALRKAKRGAGPDDTPAATVLALFRALLNEDVDAVKKLMPAGEKVTAATLGVSPRAIPIGDMLPDKFADLFAAMAELQTDGNDDSGYRVRMRLFNGTQRQSQNWFVQRENGKLVIAGTDQAWDSVGAAVLKLAAAGKVDAARTWLNWLREDYSAGGGDDPLGGSAFTSLWPKDKQSATLDDVRLAGAVLTTAGDKKKDALPILVAAREKAADDQKKWIDVALIGAYDGAPEAMEIAQRLLKSYPDSPRAFTMATTALIKNGKADEAEALAKQRLEKTPRSHEALLTLSSIAARRNDYAAASSYARRIIDELSPTDTDYNHAAWIALFAGKDLDRAIEDAHRASSGGSRTSVSASLHTLASLYAETGKNLEARQALLQSIEKRWGETLSPADWYVVGRMAENYGVADAAVAAYKRVEKTPATGLSTWELSQRRLAALTVK